jgi:hypothetical protein
MFVSFIIIFLFLFCLSSFFSIFMRLFIYFFYFLFQKNSSFSNMFYNKNNLKKLLYFCLIRCRFEVWKKKTSLIIFSSMVFFLFLLLFVLFLIF